MLLDLLYLGFAARFDLVGDGCDFSVLDRMVGRWAVFGFCQGGVLVE